ncbi:MAG TPA: hypothetical protein VK627_03110 [Edaphobacter sp.]|nr:hypothetical protein [Edaphobacter sp.]
MNLPRHAEIWLPGYIRDRARRLGDHTKAKRLWVSITDHYEPLGGKVSTETAVRRVGRWQDAWPGIAEAAPRDADGKRPCYSFFYPQEEYRPELLEPLAEMTREGIGDVEIHIHHEDETAEGFVQKMSMFCRQLRDDHGLLHDHNGKLVFGFIHGNWALDDSHPSGRFCGVPEEIRLLRELGCYADFTMPSSPSPTQGRIVNQVYWCSSTPGQTKAFNRGIEATVGGGVQGDLLMITGPLGLRFAGRMVPRVETGELASYDPPTAYRVKRWLDLAPRVGDDIFLKLYSHGAREDNADALLGTGSQPSGMQQMFQWLHEAAAERNIELHWASAYEMFCAAEALVKGAAVGETSKASVTSGAGVR